MTNTEMRRALELAGDAKSPADHELLRQLRAEHVGDDWMHEERPS